MIKSYSPLSNKSCCLSWSNRVFKSCSLSFSLHTHSSPPWQRASAEVCVCVCVCVHVCAESESGEDAHLYVHSEQDGAAGDGRRGSLSPGRAPRTPCCEHSSLRQLARSLSKMKPSSSIQRNENTTFHAQRQALTRGGCWRCLLLTQMPCLEAMRAVCQSQGSLSTIIATHVRRQRLAVWGHSWGTRWESLPSAAHGSGVS